MAEPIITLACPNCGANLDLSPDTEKLTCLYCGRVMIVNREESVNAQGSSEPMRVVVQVGDMQVTVRQATPSKEGIEADLLIERMQSERQAVKASATPEQHHLAYHRDSLLANRFFGFVAPAGCLWIGGCAGLLALGTLCRGLDGDITVSETISVSAFYLFVTALVLGAGFLLRRAFISAARSQSEQIQQHEQQAQAARSQIERL